MKKIVSLPERNGNPMWQDTYEYGILKEEWKSYRK